jgi:hypothetical protein
VDVSCELADDDLVDPSYHSASVTLDMGRSMRAVMLLKGSYRISWFGDGGSVSGSELLNIGPQLTVVSIR